MSIYHDLAYVARFRVNTSCIVFHALGSTSRETKSLSLSHLSVHTSRVIYSLVVLEQSEIN